MCLCVRVCVCVCYIFNEGGKIGKSLLIKFVGIGQGVQPSRNIEVNERLSDMVSARLAELCSPEFWVIN